MPEDRVPGIGPNTEQIRSVRPGSVPFLSDKAINKHRIGVPHAVGQTEGLCQYGTIGTGKFDLLHMHDMASLAQI